MTGGLAAGPINKSSMGSKRDKCCLGQKFKSRILETFFWYKHEFF